ncbi:MAG: FecR domain-containing protein [Pseudomonadota bacterium]
MTNLVQFPDPKRIRQEAAAWLAQMEKGLTPDDEDALGEWLQASTHHAETFLRMAALSDQMEVLQELSSLFPLPEPETTKTSWSGRFAIACGVAAIGVAVGLYFGSASDEKERQPIVQTVSTEYDTAVGEQRTEELADSSTILINTDSSLSVDYDQSVRTVKLHKGEAHFQVEKDTQRPFVVYAGTKIVKAVGTAFSVEVLPNDVQVTVTEGEVIILDPKNAHAQESSGTSLIQGEKASLTTPSTIVERIPPEQIEIELAWHRGFIIFQGESLEEALSELSRYSTQQYVIADPEIKDKTLGGYCRTDDVDGFLFSLRDSIGVAATRNADGVILLTAL